MPGEQYEHTNEHGTHKYKVIIDAGYTTVLVQDPFYVVLPIGQGIVEEVARRIAICIVNAATHGYYLGCSDTRSDIMNRLEVTTGDVPEKD